MFWLLSSTMGGTVCATIGISYWILTSLSFARSLTPTRACAEAPFLGVSVLFRVSADWDGSSRLVSLILRSGTWVGSPRPSLSDPVATLAAYLSLLLPFTGALRATRRDADRRLIPLFVSWKKLSGHTHLARFRSRLHNKSFCCRTRSFQTSFFAIKVQKPQ